MLTIAHEYQRLWAVQPQMVQADYTCGSVKQQDEVERRYGAHLFQIIPSVRINRPWSMFIYQTWLKLLCQVHSKKPFTILTCFSWPWPPHLSLKFQSDPLLVIQGTTPTCPAQLCIRTPLLTNLFSPQYVRAPQMLMKWYLTSRDVLEFVLLLVGRRII